MESGGRVRTPERLLSEAIAERRATPRFDGMPLPNEALSTIISAGIEAPSGYNLQPWRFVVVRSIEQKRRLREAAMGQSKISEAGAIIVFCGHLDAPRGENLENVLARAAEHGFSEEENLSIRETISRTFDAPAGDAMGIAPSHSVWINRHVMIAFTTMMWMAEVLGYDTAPMEGFSEGKVKEMLKMPIGTRVIALLAIGKLKGEDKRHAGRHEMRNVCFAEIWGQSVDL